MKSSAAALHLAIDRSGLNLENDDVAALDADVAQAPNGLFLTCVSKDGPNSGNAGSLSRSTRTLPAGTVGLRPEELGGDELAVLGVPLAQRHFGRVVGERAAKDACPGDRD